MKPRNQREKEVVKLSDKLPPLTKAQIHWGIENAVPRVIYTTGKKCWCTLCGHTFDASPGETHECPNCHRESKVEKSRKRLNRGFEYQQFITVKKGWQVIRYILFKWESRAGEKLQIDTMTFMEKWCRPGQPMITMAGLVKMCPYWREQPYSEYSPISIKNPSYFSSEWMRVRVYPKKILLPTYFKCGYQEKMWSDYDAEQIFGKIFAIPHFEALYKSGKFKELHKKMRDAELFSKYWPSIKVALRHGFDPYKLNISYNYWDYLGMLKFLHKDMRSPRYVAPKDWDDIHNRINEEAAKKRLKIERRRQEREELRRALMEEEQRKREIALEGDFTKRIRKFAALVITDESLCISPLMSIQEFFDEGKAMHHCVFSGGYYKRKDSLVLSARNSNGERLETIEINLLSMSIAQSFGVSNSITFEHEHIAQLINKNMETIRAMNSKKAIQA